MKKVVANSFRLRKVLFSVFKSVPFITITVFGNILVIGYAGVLWWLEKGINPELESFMDALWWSFSTATTVGYGDVVPVTVEGRFLGIFLMLMGTAIFVSYTGILAQALLGDEVEILRKSRQKKHDLERLANCMEEMNRTIQELQVKITELQNSGSGPDKKDTQGPSS